MPLYRGSRRLILQRRPVVVVGAAPTWTKTANPAHQNLGFASPATFNNVNTGAGLVVIAIQMVNASALTDVRLNGNAMTLGAKSTIASLRSAAIWYISGQSANANSTVVLTGGAMGAVAIQAGVLTGVNAAPTATATRDYATSASPYNIGSPIAVPATGFGIGCAYVDTPNTFTGGTGVTVEYQTDDGVDLVSILASMPAGASQQLSFNGTNFQGVAGAFVAWGP